MAKSLPGLETKTKVEFINSDFTLNGYGNLDINSDMIKWTTTEKCFSFTFPKMILHALQRPTENQPCFGIYVQLEGSVNVKGVQDADEGDGCEVRLTDEEDSGLEIRFVPESEDELGDIYQAICDCAALNPYEESESEDPEIEMDRFEDAQE